MFSAAGTPPEAILRATSREELYQRVCDAVVDEGGSIATAILAAAADSGLTYAAGTGRQMEEFSRLGIEAGVNPAAAHDLASVAFYTVRSCFTNDYVNDERVHAWREAGIRRAATREKLYQLVREAAVRGGNFTYVVIALAEPGNEFFNIVVTTGPNADIPGDARLATTTDHVGGRGLAGIAFRTRQPCIGNDYLTDERCNSIHDFVRRTPPPRAIAVQWAVVPAHKTFC